MLSNILFVSCDILCWRSHEHGDDPLATPGPKATGLANRSLRLRCTAAEDDSRLRLSMGSHVEDTFFKPRKTLSLGK